MKYGWIKALLLGLLTTGIWANEWDFLTVNGYGTLGGAYQDNDAYLYKDSSYASRGSEGEFSFANYTLLGLQLDAQVSDRLSLTVQGIASPNNENGHWLELEWANAKYQLTDSFDVRVGRMRSPTFMFSDILHVAYSYDWIHLPDMYTLVPFNKYQGIELSHNWMLDDLYISSSVLYGQASSMFRDGKGNQAEGEAENAFGAYLRLIYNELSMRVAYSRSSYTYDDPIVNQGIDQFSTLGIAQISDFIERYQIQDTALDYVSVGMRYDFEQSYLLGEYMHFNTESFLADRSSWYFGAGYNFETWAPYVLFSKTIYKENVSNIPTEGATPEEIQTIMIANQLMRQSLEKSDATMDTFSIGMRYDMAENMLFKLQYDKKKRPKVELDVFSCAVNFVF